MCSEKRILGKWRISPETLEKNPEPRLLIKWLASLDALPGDGEGREVLDKAVNSLTGVILTLINDMVAYMNRIDTLGPVLVIPDRDIQLELHDQSLEIFDLRLALERAMENAKRILGDAVELCENMYDVAEGVDALMLVTEWTLFREPDFERLHKAMKTPVVFDGRNIYDPERMRKMGFEYFGIGRGSIPNKA
jgi:hypothetical protein